MALEPHSALANVRRATPGMDVAAGGQLPDVILTVLVIRLPRRAQQKAMAIRRPPFDYDTLLCK